MNQELPMHRISWHIDLPAANPQAAAALAMKIQRDPASNALVFEVNGETVDLTQDTTFAPRSLRPGLEYRTRSGLRAEIVEWDRGGDFPLAVRIFDEYDTAVSGLRTKAGLHPASSGDHPGDILEVNPGITKWVRVYDKKLNEAGKQVVGGKEFAAERGLNWYIFDTEEEARANLQGVRAVFPITYREGEGLG